MMPRATRSSPLDKRHVWHPYTPMARTSPRPTRWSSSARRGRASSTSTARATSTPTRSWWVAALGHSHPRLVAALTAAGRAAVATCRSAGITHDRQRRSCAEELVAVAPPGLARVFFSDNGSTAVEVGSQDGGAMRCAEQRAPQRTRFVALEGAFHGETIGATSLGGVEVFRRPFAGMLFDCVHVPSPGRRRAPTRAPSKSSSARSIAGARRDRGRGARAARAGRRRACACTTPSTCGTRAPSATRTRSRWSFDEVFTGYGRTGPMWACDLARRLARSALPRQGFSRRHVADGRDARHRAHLRAAFSAAKSARSTTATRTAGTRWAPPSRARCCAIYRRREDPRERAEPKARASPRAFERSARSPASRARARSA